MSFRTGLLLTALFLVSPLIPEAQAPTPLVERITSQFGKTTRVTLFSNHVAVVAVRSESEDFVHQATLSYSEHMVYLQALESAAKKIGGEPVSSDVESRDSSTRLILHVGPEAPRIIEYSPLASLNLETARIASIVDDIQNRALAALPGEFEILEWQPVVGDRVELRQGGEAIVVAVNEDDGTIVLRQSESSVSSTVAVGSRAQVILEIIERAQ